MIRKDERRKKNTELSCLTRDMVTLLLSIRETKYMTTQAEGEKKGGGKKEANTDSRWKLGEKPDSTR